MRAQSRQRRPRRRRPRASARWCSSSSRRASRRSAATPAPSSCCTTWSTPGSRFETLKTQFALCRGLDIVPMVRVPRGEYHFIARALDVGAHGRDGADGRHAPKRPRTSCRARAIRRPGRRGAAFGFAHDDYQGGDVARQDRRAPRAHAGDPADRNRRGARQRRGDCRGARRRRLWLGHFDLTNFMGIPGAVPASAITWPAVKRIVAACDAHGKAAAFLATDDGWAREYKAYGFRLYRVRRGPGDAAERAEARPRRAASRRLTMTANCASASRATSSTRAASPRSAARRWRSSTTRPNARMGVSARGRAASSRPSTPRATTRVYVNTARTPASAVARGDCRLRVVARHGVGYDSVDVPAMTRAGVVVTNTPMPMPRPVATIALTFILALAGKLMLKDRLTRSGRWHERMDNMGMGLTGRTLGVIGAGRIGKELLRMARTFDLKLLATDPYVECRGAGLRRRAQGRPATRCCAKSDFVVAIPSARRGDAPPHRRARSSRCMKPTAYFINVSRGPVVDEPALIAALQRRPHRRRRARRLRAGAGRSAPIRCSRWTT